MSRSAMQTAITRCGWLSGATALLWLALAGPAFLLSGTNGLEGLSYSALLCLIPGWLVFLMASLYRVANTQAFVVLAGTAVRLLFVLFGVMGVRAVRPQLQLREFLVWVIIFYLATLAVETMIMVKQATEKDSVI